MAHIHLKDTCGLVILSFCCVGKGERDKHRLGYLNSYIL